ncbi:MAG: NDP-sugar synthase [Elusimicrobiota bacterium]
MIAGIIAAGHGSRMAEKHPRTVKPLIPVAGRPLAHWVVGSLDAAGMQSLTLLTNSRGTAVPASLARSFPNLRFDFLCADTASSFESFRLVAKNLAQKDDSFLISTVDALIAAEDIKRFWNECRARNAQAGLALTRFVDDEKPLWADRDETGFITAVGDLSRTRLTVTCGLYFMTRAAAERLPAAQTHGRLRDFWADLVATRARVFGVELSRTLDVDRPQDLATAEEFLTTGRM